MTQALFTAQTGLNAGTQQLSVVSDNVANMNTTAYKTSRLNFQDVWYQTKTTGTNSTSVLGGTNPYQWGVGVKCASITKNFDAASTVSTGRASDLAITGPGWFTVLNPDGAVLYTRDGTFSLDENGYLCTANGYKLLGTDNITSATGSTTPVKLPTRVRVIEEPTPKGQLSSKRVSELNNSETLTGGQFKVVLTKKDGGSEEVIIDMENIDKNTTLNGIVEAINADSGKKFTASIEDGVIQFKIETNTYSDIKFESIPGGSNFVSQTGLANMSTSPDGTVSTVVLNMDATITEVEDITSDETHLYKSYSVGQDGLVTVTYGDGSTLTVATGTDGLTYFEYTDANGIIIQDDVNNSGNASLYVDPNVLVKANMQIQLAKVTNDNGMVAIGSNTYERGPDCGDIIYTAAGINGTGQIASGALESSNVDLAEQFANMILAQRLVQANSQVFNGANTLLETLVYLGR